jgi:hypothetical protein
MEKEQYETIKSLLEENNALLSKLVEIFESEDIEDEDLDEKDDIDEDLEE